MVRMWSPMSDALSGIVTAVMLAACGGSADLHEGGASGSFGNGGSAASGGSGAQSGAGAAAARPTSDELDALPDVVYLKTNTQSFNRMYYLAVLDGELWIKPNVESTGIDAA